MNKKSHCVTVAEGYFIYERAAFDYRAATAAMMTPKSINTLRRKTGIVTFVGCAARLLTRAMPMAAMASTIKVMFTVPPKKVAITVSGVRMQPCAERIMPSHKKRLWFCAVHQEKNLEKAAAVALVCW